MGGLEPLVLARGRELVARVLARSSRAAGSGVRTGRPPRARATCRPAAPARRDRWCRCPRPPRAVKLPANTPSRRNSVARVAQQVVAPLQRRPQRLLARERGAVPPRSSRKRVVEPLGDLRRATGRRPAPPPARAPAACRPAAGRSRRPPAAFSAVSAKPGATPRAARSTEQPHRLGVGGVGAPAGAERRHAPGDLARDPQRLAAGGEDAQRSGRRAAARSASAAQASSRCSQLSSTSSSAARRRSGPRARRRVGRSERSWHAERAAASRRRRAPGRGSGASSTSQAPSRSRPRRRAASSQRQPRLPAPARPGERQQPRRPASSRSSSRQLALAADEAGERRGRLRRGRAPALGVVPAAARISR